MLSEKISRAVQEQNALLATLHLQTETLESFASQVVEAFHQGGRLLLLGNGTLGAIANLIASNFLHRLSLERPPLPVLSFSQDMTLATALERAGLGRQFFARQLRVVAQAPDVVLAFADFQHDVALEEGLATARQAGCTTALLQPGRGEPAGEPTDFLFCLDTDSVPRAMEAALFFGNLLCELVEGELFGI
ncbi:MAG: SIS domain-containing protein [Desulfuromonadales bacterium]|nr:SIS domain-containing protein [Desulfuromonadales bacterium]